ncbi:MAG TPA: hypothetical protein VHJ17_09390, partial [Thermomonospora sp.]|nr:hypothetical protein [Thermomonospora sp.]
MPFPLFSRLPVGAWTALAWCAGLLVSYVVEARLPGEPDDFTPGGMLSGLQAGHWLTLAVAALATANGCLVLARRPLPGLGLLLGGAVCTAMALNSTEIAFQQFLPAEVALAYIAATRDRRA